MKSTFVQAFAAGCAVFFCDRSPSFAALVTLPDGAFYHATGPFYDGGAQSGTTRYQEVFSHEAFEGLSPDGILITGLGFYSRTPGTNQSFTLSLGLSTTSRNPDGLSSAFADNLGPDNGVVFESLTPILVSTMPDGQGRNVYEFPLQQPFVYFPQNGNLLLEVRNFDSIFTAVDAPDFAHVSSLGDPVSRLYAQNANADFGAPGTDGLQVRFTYEAIPEPTALTLFVLGAGVLFCLRMCRRGASFKKSDSPEDS